MLCGLLNKSLGFPGLLSDLFVFSTSKRCSVCFQAFASLLFRVDSWQMHSGDAQSPSGPEGDTEPPCCVS